MIWKHELRPIDLHDPATGEPLYVIAAIRPRWYWTICRVRLFFRSLARWGRDSLCPSGAAFVSTMPAPSGFLDGAGCEKIVGS